MVSKSSSCKAFRKSSTVRMLSVVVWASSVMVASLGDRGRQAPIWPCGRVRRMRVAVVAGPDPGHSFPAIALCQRFCQSADTPTLFTGPEWLEAARAAGIDAVELDGLAATDD